jgi:phage anti-repressor protein
MTRARQATDTVTFVDEYAERYQDLFPDVRSFEQFKYRIYCWACERNSNARRHQRWPKRSEQKHKLCTTC